MANSLADIFAALQNGVIALSNLGRQLTGSFNNISAKLALVTPSSLIVPSSGVVTTIAGNSGAFTLNGTSGITNTVNDIQLSQGSASQFGAVKVNNTTITAAAGVVSLAMSPITNSLSGTVSMGAVGAYADGPSVAQGSSGTWFVSGTVLVQDNLGVANIVAKLWDGTTVIASANVFIPLATAIMPMSLSGFIASPSSNLKISCSDNTSTSGKIIFNQSGSAKDSTITAVRIG